jgi:energy-coupling factor transport system substrate-specific component
MDVRWVPAPAAALLLAALVTVPAAPARADATADAAAASASLRYLLKAQNDDGGWGGAPGQSSSELYSGWAALGVASAGRNPRDVGRAIAYTRSHRAKDLGALSRTILVLRAAGLNAGDLAGQLASKRKANGSYAGRVNTTAFAVLALKAAGRKGLNRSGRWIASQANRDGGFNFSGRGGPSGIDDTGAAVQGLVAAGRRRTKTVRRAVRFMLRRQNPDGGFPLTPGGASNAQSTAWAVQAFLAAGRNPDRVTRKGSRNPMAYLRSLTAASGEVQYSRTSRQTPVWVTAQAVMALARKPLPLAPVPRAERAERAERAVARPAATPTATATPTAAPKPRPKPKPEPKPRRTGGTAAPRRTVSPLVVAVASPRRARDAGFVAGTVIAAVL